MELLPISEEYVLVIWLTLSAIDCPIIADITVDGLICMISPSALCP